MSRHNWTNTALAAFAAVPEPHTDGDATIDVGTRFLYEVIAAVGKDIVDAIDRAARRGDEQQTDDDLRRRARTAHLARTGLVAGVDTLVEQVTTKRGKGGVTDAQLLDDVLPLFAELADRHRMNTKGA